MSVKALLLVAMLNASLAAQTVSVVDADPNNGIRFTTSGNSVSLPIYLELDQGKVGGLRVLVDNFVGPDGSLVPVTVTLNGAAPSTPIDVTQQDRAQVQISATLSVSGDYRSHISLFYSDKRQKSIPITITRQRNALPIQIEGLNTVATTHWFKASTVTADFIIRETSGQRASLYLPTLIGLAVKDGDKKRQAACDTVRFEVTGDKTYIHIGSQASIPGKLILTKLRGTGEYSAKIRVASADTTPVDADLTILVKDNWLVAVFFILVGVVSSYVIRRYTKESRPKLVALRTLTDIRDALDKVQSDAGELDDKEKTVIDGLRNQIAILDRDLARGTTSDTGASALKDLQDKLAFLPPWLTIGRKLRNVSPPSLVGTPSAKWEAIADSYFLTKGVGAAPMDTLTAIRAEIDKAVKDNLLARILEFQKTADDHKASQPASADAIEAGVVPLLAKAKEEATNDKLLEATATFQDARRSYGRIIAQQLTAELRGQPPPGFTQEEWDSLRRQLEVKLDEIKALRETDPALALSQFEAANQHYIEALIRAMRKAVAASATALASGVLSQDAQNAVQSKLDNGIKALDIGEVALGTGQTDDARKSYQQAADALREVSNEIQKAGGGQLGFSLSQVLPSLMTMPSLAGIKQTTSVPESKLRAMSKRDKFTLLIDEYDLWLNVMILLIATVVGLNVLWASDPAWGGWKAYITALLWGLGLQQAGGATQDGLSAVTKKFTE